MFLICTILQLKNLSSFIIFQKVYENESNIKPQWPKVSSLTNAPKWLKKNCGAKFAVRKYTYETTIKANHVE